MLVWATPVAFLALLPLMAAYGWTLWCEKTARPSLQFSSLRFATGVSPTLRAQLRWVPGILGFLSAVLAVVALARPQLANIKQKRNVEGIDIMMVLDVSDSMSIEDMDPNRLEASKQMIRDFVVKRVSDKIGLVVFSGESYTRVPLTLDYPVLLQSVKEVQTSRNIKMGTAIGVALANGAARLKESTAKSRIMIFLTDGENNSGTIDPLTALEIAKQYKIKIYTIGAGQDGDAQLPVVTMDAFGRKIKRYQPIHSKVNDELLSKMASETGGKYYRAKNKVSLENVFQDIDRLEKSKIEIEQYTEFSELFPKYLAWSLILAALAMVLGQTVFRRAP